MAAPSGTPVLFDPPGDPSPSLTRRRLLWGGLLGAAALAGCRAEGEGTVVTGAAQSRREQMQRKPDMPKQAKKR